MADIAAIRAGIARNLADVAGFQVSPYMLSSPTPPAAHVIPGEIEFDKAMARGSDRLVMLVQAFVALGTDIGAQKRLDAFLAGAGTSSFKEAIESDTTLAGAAHDLRVTGIQGYRVFTFEGKGQMLGAELRVEVWAPGT